ncbi:MAG TPA: T9SS type A sorting domain-containing protein [Candidatus Marinimicrobia bacterium]|nr:T9SS type A sorting domain-containing protein [Candidatus Neomarinimicrobiota bacterium]
MKSRIFSLILTSFISLNASYLWLGDNGPINAAQETVQFPVYALIPDSIAITGFQFDLVFSHPISDIFAVEIADDYNLSADDLSFQMLDSLRTRVLWAPFTGDTLKLLYEGHDYFDTDFHLLTLIGGYSPNHPFIIDTIRFENVIFSDPESQPVAIQPYNATLFSDSISYMSYENIWTVKNRRNYETMLMVEIFPQQQLAGLQFDLIKPAGYALEVTSIQAWENQQIEWNSFGDTIRIVLVPFENDTLVHGFFKIALLDSTWDTEMLPIPLITANIAAGDSAGNAIPFACANNFHLEERDNLNSVSHRDAPNAFHLKPVYPNPFNPSTNISFNLPEMANVSLMIFNIQGQQVHSASWKAQPAGSYNYIWNAAELSSGLYLIQLSAGSQIITMKALLLK